MSTCSLQTMFNKRWQARVKRGRRQANRTRLGESSPCCYCRRRCYYCPSRTVLGEEEVEKAVCCSSHVMAAMVAAMSIIWCSPAFAASRLLALDVADGLTRSCRQAITVWSVLLCWSCRTLCAECVCMKQNVPVGGGPSDCSLYLADCYVTMILAAAVAFAWVCVTLEQSESALWWCFRFDCSFRWFEGGAISRYIERLISLLRAVGTAFLPVVLFSNLASTFSCNFVPI